MEPILTRYVQSLAGYQRNRFPDLSAPLKARIAAEWSQSFSEWKYPI